MSAVPALHEMWFSHKSITISSPNFKDNSLIPDKYTCKWEWISPEINIWNVLDDTVSLVLIMEDPDVPKQNIPSGMFDHWVLFNIDPSTRIIAEWRAPSDAIHWTNSAWENKYIWSCPPDIIHRYMYHIFALDTMLDLEAWASKDRVVDAMRWHIIDHDIMVGLVMPKWYEAR